MASLSSLIYVYMCLMPLSYGLMAYLLSESQSFPTSSFLNSLVPDLINLL